MPPVFKRVYIKSNELLALQLELFTEAKFIAVDTETTGLSFIDDKIRLVQITAPVNGESITLIIDLFWCDVKLLKPLLEGTATKLFYNAKFDIKFLRSYCINVSSPIIDVMIYYKVLRNGITSHYGLKDACEDLLSIPIDKKEQKSNWSLPELSQAQLLYAAQDTEVLFKLFLRLRKEVEYENLTHIVELEQDALLATIDMEYNGIPVDVEVLTQLDREVAPQVAESRANALKLFHDSGAEIKNLNSTPQLLTAFAALGLPLENSQKATLEDNIHLHPVIAPLMEYKSTTKLMQFVTKLPTFVRNGRIHCSFNQLGTDSGRYSCSTPNMQQIPRSSVMRSFVRAGEGNMLIVADYSQIELVIAAQLTQDVTLLDAFINGIDVHRLTASFICHVPYDQVTKQQRQLAKAINFGLIYGMGAPKFQRYARVSYKVNITLEEAYAYRDEFFTRYPGFREWHKKSSIEIDSGENASYTLGGRRRLFSHVYNDPHLIRFSAYINHQDQGTGGDVTKLALVYAREAFKNTDAKLVMTVHDEIMLEAPEEIAEAVKVDLVDCMIRAGQKYITDCPVAVECGIAKTWDEAH